MILILICITQDTNKCIQKCTILPIQDTTISKRSIIPKKSRRNLLKVNIKTNEIILYWVKIKPLIVLFIDYIF